MKKFEPTCYRYKTEVELTVDIFEAREQAIEDGKNPDTVKVRKTKDILCTVEPYYMNATAEEPTKGRRMVKVRFHRGREYHMPIRDWSLIIASMGFEVRDTRT